MKGSPSLLLAAMLSLPRPGARCRTGTMQTVNFSDVGWTDITVDDRDHQRSPRCAWATRPRTTMISVPVTYKSLADGKNMDVFLGNWMPTMENDIKAVP